MSTFTVFFAPLRSINIQRSPVLLEVLRSALRSTTENTSSNARRLIAVDDRSTDGTGAVLDALAATHPRLKVLHKTVLEEGWLGKVAALDAGLKLARSEWILFADADVHFEPRALERLISLALQLELDHLAVLPRFVTTGPWQGAMMATFIDGFCARTRGCRHQRSRILIPLRPPEGG